MWHAFQRPMSCNADRESRSNGTSGPYGPTLSAGMLMEGIGRPICRDQHLQKGGPMNGIFELFTDGQANVRFRLVDSEGRELAVSCSYVDKDSAVQGISHVRECAGMGLVRDHCSPMTPADTKPEGSRVPVNGRMSRAAE